MREIPLSTKGYVALVDDDAYELVSRFKWRAAFSCTAVYALSRSPYVRGQKEATIQMHRLILGITDKNIWVDHIDHNGLNNQRANLRLCTPSQNQHNTRRARNNRSGIKGVYWNVKSKKWCAHIKAAGKTYHLGFFTDKQAAAGAYAAAARELHGEFANPEGL